MNFLPFERTYQLESSPCVRCAGSGRYAASGRQCYNCRGLGRSITAAGRALFSEICALLGKPVLTKESRIQPKHLERILGRQLRVGMRVARVGPRPRTPVHTIVELVPIQHGARLVFDDGTIAMAGELDTYDRELTDDELRAVAALMQARIDAGATPRDT